VVASPVILLTGFVPVSLVLLMPVCITVCHLCRALRARIYDDAVRGYASEIGVDRLHKELLIPNKPVSLPKPNMTPDLLHSYGDQLVAEQDNVKRVQVRKPHCMSPLTWVFAAMLQVVW
jgi:hypothetical protein